MGAPCVIGKDGVEKVVEIELSKDEKIAFDKSVDSVRGLMQAIKL